MTDEADASLVFHARLQRDGTFQFATVPNGTYTLSTSNVKLEPDNGDEVAPVTGQPELASAFTDGSLGVIVKDADVPDLLLTLTELPVAQAPDTTKPALPTRRYATPH